MGATLDRGDDRHADVGYVFQNLNAFVVNLTPDAGIGDIAEEDQSTSVMNSPPAPARSYDLVRSILGNTVKGIDKFCVSWRGHNERPAVAVELSNQHTFVISCQL